MSRRSVHYDWQGRPVSFQGWAQLYRYGNRVALTELDDLSVSTVWLGIDHGFAGGPPLIFETLIFGHEGHQLPGACWRYSTEQEAREGHDHAVTLALREHVVLKGITST